MAKYLKADLKNKIIEYLRKNGCGLYYQIVKYLQISDTRYISSPLDELLEEKMVEKVKYKGYYFYVISRNDSEIKKKVKLIRKYIIDVVHRKGPLKSRKIAYFIEKDYECEVTSQLVSKIAKDLINEDKLAFKLIGTKLYMEKNNPFQEKIAKDMIKEAENRKKLRLLKKRSENIINALISDYNLSENHVELLNSIFSKNSKFLTNFDAKGKNFDDIIIIFKHLLVKREIFIILKKKEVVFNEIKPWLLLHEIISEVIRDSFQGNRYKAYTKCVKNIFGLPNFCNQKHISSIKNAPDLLVRIRYLLSTFNFSVQVIDEIIFFIKECISLGFNIQGKDIKGIVGGVVYLFSKQNNVNLTQKQISKKLNMTEVTIRKRRDEFLNFFEKKYKRKKEKPEIIDGFVSLMNFIDSRNIKKTNEKK